MTQLRWGILLFLFLFPAATDLLFREVSSIWLVGCTVLALIGNLFCGFGIFRLVLCLIPGVLLWILSRLSRGIGIGDVLAVFLLGAIAGFQMSLEILFGGSILCFAAQIFLMTREKIRQWWIIKEKEKLQKERAIASVKVKKIFQSEMPFVPWILASIWINWIFQVIFS